MFSIIMPTDSNRLPHFTVTKRIYDTMPQKKEFVMPTRTFDEIYPYMRAHHLLKDVRLIRYTLDCPFNPTRALNIAVRESRYPLLILTGPEVKPTTPVLEQLSHLTDKNVMCQTFDEDVNGNLSSMVNLHCDYKTPRAYFLAMFQKRIVEELNGWDEQFMGGHAWEDNDFGARWVRGGYPFEIHEEIQAIHQYHPRAETVVGGAARNEQIYHSNNSAGVVRVKNGLVRDV